MKYPQLFAEQFVYIDKVKQLGQVMTPYEIISYMVDLLSLTEEQIKTKLFIAIKCHPS